MVDYIKRMSLEGKTAYVCGGLGLIGREISKAFEEVGANVVVLDIADKDCVKFDVTNMEKYDKVLSDIFDGYGIPDIWLNASYPRTDDWANKAKDISLNRGVS